jgi:hypothetical protein
MTKFHFLTITIIAGASNLSMYHDPSTDLLDDHDYERTCIDASQGPALSSPLDGSPHWASYNQRLCFPNENVDIECMEAEYGEIRRVPALHVTSSSHYYEFSMDPEPAPDCDAIIAHWKALLADEQS